MDRVDVLTQDCLRALAQVRSLDNVDAIAPAVLNSRFVGFVDDLLQRGRHSGLAERDVYDIAYAIVALIDETALRSPGGIRDAWMSQPLQLRYFNENLAGEGFFARLEQLLRDPRRGETLRVYYLCLLFGFEGKYAVRGGEFELAVVVRRVQDALAEQLRPRPLSARHLRPRERVTRQTPGHLTVWIGLLALLFSLALLVVLRRALDTRTDALSLDIAETLRAGE